MLRPRRFLSIPAFLDVSGVVLLTIGVVTLLSLAAGAVLLLANKGSAALFEVACDPPVRVYGFYGSVAVILGYGLRRRVRLVGFVVYLCVLQRALTALLSLPEALVKNLTVFALYDTLIWLLILQQFSKHYLVDLILALPGLEKRLKERLIDGPPASEAPALPHPWREALSRMTMGQFWTHYVLCFSGCALLFEVVKNLELCDAFLKEYKSLLFVGLFLLPVGLALLRHVITESGEEPG